MRTKNSDRIDRLRFRIRNLYIWMYSGLFLLGTADEKWIPAAAANPDRLLPFFWLIRHIFGFFRSGRVYSDPEPGIDAVFRHLFRAPLSPVFGRCFRLFSGAAFACFRAPLSPLFSPLLSRAIFLKRFLPKALWVYIMKKSPAKTAAQCLLCWNSAVGSATDS